MGIHTSFSYARGRHDRGDLRPAHCVCVHYTTDFTGMGPYLMAALLGLIVFGFSIMVFSWIVPGLYSTAHLIYAALGAVLFSFYIVYDTQLIVGGRHKKHQFSVDDYALAALNLFLDII